MKPKLWLRQNKLLETVESWRNNDANRRMTFYTHYAVIVVLSSSVRLSVCWPRANGAGCWWARGKQNVAIWLVVEWSIVSHLRSNVWPETYWPKHLRATWLTITAQFSLLNKSKYFFAYLYQDLDVCSTAATIFVFCDPLALLPLQYFHQCLVNMGFSRLPAYSQCIAPQRNRKSPDSLPWAKDSDPLHTASWASHIACPLHNIWKQTAANGANGGLNPSEPNRHRVAPAAWVSSN